MINRLSFECNICNKTVNGIDVMRQNVINCDCEIRYSFSHLTNSLDININTYIITIKNNNNVSVFNENSKTDYLNCLKINNKKVIIQELINNFEKILNIL